MGLDVQPAAAPSLGKDDAVLATWRQLLDLGTLQADEPELAGTARPAVALIGAEAAARLGLADGDRLTVSRSAGSITLPVRVAPMPDQVVWVPMRTPGSEVRTRPRHRTRWRRRRR